MVGVVGNDIGMGIRKSIQCGVIPTLFGCFLGIPSLYVLSFLKCFFCGLFRLFFWREKSMVLLAIAYLLYHPVSAVMNFIDVVAHSAEDMNFQVHLQYEFSLLGLDDILEVCANDVCVGGGEGELHVYMYMHCVYEMTIFIREMMNLLSARMECGACMVLLG